jgi:hypothetical protein
MRSVHEVQDAANALGATTRPPDGGRIDGRRVAGHSVLYRGCTEQHRCCENFKVDESVDLRKFSIFPSTLHHARYQVTVWASNLKQWTISRDKLQTWSKRKKEWSLTSYDISVPRIAPGRALGTVNEQDQLVMNGR